MVQLEDYYFPVATRDVLFGDNDPDLYSYTDKYKAIVRLDKSNDIGLDGKLIAINPSTYKVVTNREVIERTMEQLEKLGVEYHVNQSHSFVEDHRMKLQLEFPELTFNDGSSDVNMSLFIHNSYNQAEGIRILWGAIRLICANGMIWGTVMKKIYMRHRGKIEIRMDKIGEELSETFHMIPELEERVKILKAAVIYPELLDSLKKAVGVTPVQEAIDNPAFANMNQYMLYNMLTYYISHNVAQHLRTQKQLALARTFAL